MIPPFEIFGKTFAIYPLIALAGFFVSGIFACVQIKKRGFDENDMICVLLFCGVGALIGGHMLYGLTNPTLFFQTFSMLPQTGFSEAFWQSAAATFGGSVFYGGLLGGMVTGGA